MSTNRQANWHFWWDLAGRLLLHSTWIWKFLRLNLCHPIHLSVHPLLTLSVRGELGWGSFLSTTRFLGDGKTTLVQVLLQFPLSPLKLTSLRCQMVACRLLKSAPFLCPAISYQFSLSSCSDRHRSVPQSTTSADIKLENERPVAPFSRHFWSWKMISLGGPLPLFLGEHLPFPVFFFCLLSTAFTEWKRMVRWWLGCQSHSWLHRSVIHDVCISSALCLSMMEQQG